HERLSRVTGLAVLSSDAMSSVAFATDFILATLIVAGTQANGYAIPISLIIASLLAIVAFSYRQTIYAYPTGGGAYRVAQGKHRHHGRAHRGGFAAGRLHPDRLVEHFGRRPRHHVGRSAARSLPRRVVPVVFDAADDRQLAGHSRVRPDLRRTD